MSSPRPGYSVLLVRHGRTSWNRDGRRQGREDIPLEEHGVEQAIALGLALADHTIDLAFSSPLGRARTTAEYVLAGRNVALAVDDRLLEFDYGSLSGTVRAEVPLSLRHQHMDDPVPGGESLRQAWARAESFAADLRDLTSPGGAVLVVGHARQQGLLLGVLSGWTLEHTAKNKDNRLSTGSYLAVEANR